jgi:hypothetical protein
MAATANPAASRARMLSDVLSQDSIGGCLRTLERWSG